MHAHPHPRSHPAWGEPRPGVVGRIVGALKRRLGGRDGAEPHGLPELPLTLRRGELAASYLAAEHDGDHAAAGAAAEAAAERAATDEAWWPADAWAHRALWHYERAELVLDAIRAARRIGDVRAAAGDPASARRYYAEAIDEARDVGAEREQGLAAVGLGHALLELGEVTQARRLAGAAVDLLDRAGAPAGELTTARELLGTEVPIGEGGRTTEEQS